MPEPEHELDVGDLMYSFTTSPTLAGSTPEKGIIAVGIALSFTDNAIPSP